jgi:hypothetical protein
MDLRIHPRWETDAPVHVTVLGESEAKVPARITNFSDDGIGLLVSNPLAIGAAVKVEWNITLLLGEVCHCSGCAEGFSIGLHLEHALHNTAELAEFAKRYRPS